MEFGCKLETDSATPQSKDSGKIRTTLRSNCAILQQTIGSGIESHKTVVAGLCWEFFHARVAISRDVEGCSAFRVQSQTIQQET